MSCEERCEDVCEDITEPHTRCWTKTEKFQHHLPHSLIKTSSGHDQAETPWWLMIGSCSLSLTEFSSHTACRTTQAGNPSIDDGVRLQQSWWSTRVLQSLHVLHAWICMTSQQLWNRFLWFKLFLTLTWQTTLILCPHWLLWPLIGTPVLMWPELQLYEPLTYGQHPQSVLQIFPKQLISDLFGQLLTPQTRSHSS